MSAAGKPGRWRRDLGWVALAALAVYLLSLGLELHERYERWLDRYEHWQLDELPLALAVLACGMAWYAFRRRRDALLEAARRERAEAHANELLAHNRELAQGLIALQENERQALARELHDEFGQRCNAIRAETAWLCRCAGDDRDGMLAAAQRADSAAQDLYQLVRDLLRRLRPADLDALGLVAALQALCESWEERSGVSCTFHHDGVTAPLGDAVDMAIYRVTQEALTNAMRHAQATQVGVRLVRAGPDTLQLIIQDDGRGMAEGQATAGLGLLGATERAAAIGGELTIDQAPGGGVRLTMRVPLRSVPQPVGEAA